MRISREYRVWPVYARGAAMIYTPVATRRPTTKRFVRHAFAAGRMTVTRRATVSDETIVAVLSAQTTADVAAA